KSAVSEQTTAVQAGVLLSVTYRWAGPDNLYGGGGEGLVIPLDTRAVVPGAGLPTPPAATAPRAHRGSARVDARNSHVDVCGSESKPSVFAQAIKALGTKDDYRLQLGVTPKGVNFFLDPGAQDCGFPPTVVAYSTLTGLVNPQIVALASTRRPS